MPRLMNAPSITDADHEFLDAAQAWRDIAAAVLWPDFPAVVAEMSTDPRTIRRVPVEWARHVVACLDPDTLEAVSQADSRTGVADACARYRGLSAASRSRGPGAPELMVDTARLTDVLTAATTSASPPDAEVVELLVAGFSGGGTRDEHSELLPLVTRLWGRQDWESLDERYAVGSVLPLRISTHVLARTPVWGTFERTLFVAAARRQEEQASSHDGDVLWEFLMQGPPRLDTDDTDTLDAEARRLGLAGGSFPWAMLTCTVGAAPDYADLSRCHWAEHTAAVALWMARSSQRNRDAALAGHRDVLASLGRQLGSVERPRSTRRMRWVLEELAGDPELRTSLAAHCRTAESLYMWTDIATQAELAAWKSVAVEYGVIGMADLSNLLTRKDQTRGVAVDLLRELPGVLHMFRAFRSPYLNAAVIEVLVAELGDDAAMWRTAFEISSPETTMCEVLAAVKVLHEQHQDAA